MHTATQAYTENACSPTQIMSPLHIINISGYHVCLLANKKPKKKDVCSYAENAIECNSRQIT